MKFWLLIILLFGGVFVLGERFAAGPPSLFLSEASGLFRQTFFPGGKLEEKLVAEIPLAGSDATGEKFYRPQGEEKTTAEKFCSFAASDKPLYLPLIMSEVAWMGGTKSFSDEWIELKNISGNTVSIAGWQLLDKDGQIKIIFPGNEIKSGGFYLLERNDDAVPKIKADIVFSGNLRNTDEALRLFDGDCSLIDAVSANPDWPAGDNKNKFTMERDIKDLSWYPSSIAGGTPRVENSTRPSAPISAKLAATATPEAAEPPPPAEIPPQSPVLPAGSKPVVLISEIMAGIEGDAKYEFVELYNPSLQAVTLTGWTIKKRNSAGKEESLVVSGRLEGKNIPAGGYFLLVNAGGGAGSLFKDAEWPSSYVLAYTENSLFLYNDAGVAVDSVFWTEIPKGSSYERVDFQRNQFQIQPSPTPRGSK